MTVCPFTTVKMVLSSSKAESVNVLVDTKRQDNALSRDFVQRARRVFPWMFFDEYYDEGTWHEIEIRFQLNHRGQVVNIAKHAEISRQAELGSDLPPGIDVTLGSDTIKAVRQSMRRAYLNPGVGGLSPIFRGHTFDVDPDLCFVLMPFSEAWSDRIWNRHIKPTVESIGFRCKRSDDVFLPGVVVEDIWGAINTANVVVADLTGKNPNVFYELGIAHVVGVPAILLSQDHEIAAFDTAHHRQIRYQDNTDGCELLERHLAAALKSLHERTMFP